MGLFGNKREKVEKVDKYEYHSSSKNGRSGGGYGPPALIGAPPSPYFGGMAPYFDGYGQISPSGKMSKYGKYGGPNKSLYGADPMSQAMLLPPQASNPMQAQAAAMLQMQQYMQGQGTGGGLQFAGVLPPIQLPLSAAQQMGLLPGQGQSFYGGQGMVSPFFDPTNGAFQQQGAFAPYQQPNFYDPTGNVGFAGPYGYMPAAF